MASSRENGLAKSQARLLYAVCACNYIHLPLARQHKPSIFVSRFAPFRHFFTCNRLSGGANIRVLSVSNPNNKAPQYKMVPEKNGDM